MQDVMMEKRMLLMEGILTEGDLKPILSQMIAVDCAVADRYSVLKFDQLLLNNSQVLFNSLQLSLIVYV